MNGTQLAPAQRRLSRETRNLLIAACVALVALWVLARLRFPDQQVTPNPISPVLTQVAPQPTFAGLATEVARVRARLDGLVVPVSDGSDDGAGAPALHPALRVDETTAALLLNGPRRQRHPADVIAMDRASGLALVRVAEHTAQAPAPVPWAPVRLDVPRFMMMTTEWSGGLALQPVFVSALTPFRSPAWSSPIWRLPSGTGVRAGALLFTSDGEVVGLAVDEDGGHAIVPGDTLLSDAQRLRARGAAPAGDLGVDAAEITAPVAAATGAESGVVVTRVAPDGPAAGLVRPGDVIDALDEVPVRSWREWSVRSRRLSAGQLVTLTVRRADATQRVEVVAAPDDPGDDRPLGLTLRFITGLGSEVVRVESGSAADAAGLTQGDIITLVGTMVEPTPARIRAAFAAAGARAPLLVAFTRGASHHVSALAR